MLIEKDDVFPKIPDDGKIGFAHGKYRAFDKFWKLVHSILLRKKQAVRFDEKSLKSVSAFRKGKNACFLFWKIAKRNRDKFIGFILLLHIFSRFVKKKTYNSLYFLKRRSI